MNLGKRIAAATAILTGASLALTGCTPPMPPEVRAALAERKYICVDGDASVAFPHAIQGLAAGWQDSLAGACSDMTMSLAKDASAAQIDIDLLGNQPTGAYVSVPFALDATVVAVNIAGLSSINLTPANIADILSGKVTDWSDKSIAASNPGVGFTAEPILLDPRIQKNGVAPLVDWFARLTGKAFDTSKLQQVDQITVEDAMTLPEGGIAFLPYSVDSEAMWVTAGIVTDPKHANDSAIVPDSDHINSGGSQLKAIKGASGVTVSLDANRKPLAPAGQDKAVEPYQAVYAAMLNLVGADNLVARAVARFLLRQDSQGMLGASNLLPLPEAVRVEELDLVTKGLPKN